MLGTQIDSLWLFAYLGSRCKLLFLTPINTIIIIFFASLLWFILNLVFWAHPGGPAWGKLKYMSTDKKIPGPNGFPVVGSIHIMTGLAHRKLAAAANDFRAQRLMAFSIGYTRAIVTCKPEVAKQILNSSNFSDRPANETAYHLLFNRSIGFAPYGVYWTALRKTAAAHLFSPNQIKALEHQRMEIANQVVQALASAAGRDIRIRKLLKLASLNNMMFSVFGLKYDVASSSEMMELQDLVDQGYELLGQLNWSDHLPFLADFDLQKIRFRCSRLVPRVNNFVGRILNEHKTSRTGSDRTDRNFVDVLLSLEGADRLSDSDMIAVLWEMIFRGTDTVAVTMEWVLARMVLHPEVQAKVHEELDKIVGSSRAVTEGDLTELVYLTAVVKEVMRLHPPGPLLSWSRLSIRDSMVDGYHVPAGTTTMVNMWAIARDPQVWADPLKFDPQRFLSPNSEFSLFGSDLRLAPFGSGRRSCPGKILGMTTVSFWIASLLHQFEFMVSENKKGVDLSEVLRLSCEMLDPLLVRIRPRRTCFSAQPHLL